MSCSVGQWLWLDNAVLDFVNWEEKEFSVEHQCVEITAPSGYWDKSDCSSEKGFICKKPKGKSSVCQPLVTGQICSLVTLTALHHRSGSNFWLFCLAYPTSLTICSSACFCRPKALHIAVYSHVEIQ